MRLALFFLLLLGAVSASAHSIDQVTIGGKSFAPIPEIMNLGDDEVIPADVYSKYDSRLIGASIVARLHARDEADGHDKNPQFDYRKNTVIQMAFHPEFLDHIVRYGFQNQHQIKFSDGTLDSAARATTEDRLAGVRLEEKYLWGWENKVNEVRPKYSFLNFTMNPDGRHTLFIFPYFDDDIPSMYGDVFAVLKEEVKDRTTFVPTDSLVLNDIGEKELREGRHTLAYRSTKVLKKLNNELYWEAQIWGALTLADVDHVLVDCPRHAKVKPPALEKLRATGLPLYYCKDAADQSHYVKTTLVPPATSSK